MNSGEMPPVSPSGASPDSQRVSVPSETDRRRRRPQTGRPRRLPPGGPSPAGGTPEETPAPAKDDESGGDRGSIVDVRV